MGARGRGRRDAHAGAGVGAALCSRRKHSQLLEGAGLGSAQGAQPGEEREKSCHAWVGGARRAVFSLLTPGPSPGIHRGHLGWASRGKDAPHAPPQSSCCGGGEML